MIDFKLEDIQADLVKNFKDKYFECTGEVVQLSDPIKKILDEIAVTLYEHAKEREESLNRYFFETSQY